jgi:NTP pyrophosphatase (non-canonical NTP hydrolase)/phage FluMu protein Com
MRAWFRCIKCKHMFSAVSAHEVAKCPKCDYLGIPTEETKVGYMTSGLTFSTLRGANRARLPQFKNKHGELTHGPDKPDWTPAQWLQAVVGELGEYANVRKKFERGDIDLQTFRLLAIPELADVVVYLDLLANSLHIDLSTAVTEKFNEVSKRVGSNVRLEADEWHYDDKENTDGRS